MKKTKPLGLDHAAFVAIMSRDHGHLGPQFGPVIALWIQLTVEVRILVYGIYDVMYTKIIIHPIQNSIQNLNFVWADGALKHRDVSNQEMDPWHVNSIGLQDKNPPRVSCLSGFGWLEYHGKLW